MCCIRKPHNLQMAIDVRLITDLLIDFVENSYEVPKSNVTLIQFLRALESDGHSSIRSLRSMGWFGRYESLMMIYNYGNARTKKLYRYLKTVLNKKAKNKKNAALKAIALLDVLEANCL